MPSIVHYYAAWVAVLLWIYPKLVPYFKSSIQVPHHLVIIEEQTKNQMEGRDVIKSPNNELLSSVPNNFKKSTYDKNSVLSIPNIL